MAVFKNKGREIINGNKDIVLDNNSLSDIILENFEDSHKFWLDLIDNLDKEMFGGDGHNIKKTIIEENKSNIWFDCNFQDNDYFKLMTKFNDVINENDLKNRLFYDTILDQNYFEELLLTIVEEYPNKHLEIENNVEIDSTFGR